MYHKSSKADNMKKIDNYLQILVKKHAEERQRKIRRENELKTGDLDVKMDEELGRKRGYSEINNFDFADFGVDFDDIGNEEDVSIDPSGGVQDDFKVNNLLKTEPFKSTSTECSFDASDSLFEDLFNLKEGLFSKIEQSMGGGWKRVLS